MGYSEGIPSSSVTFEENKLLRGNLCAEPTKPEGYWQIDPSNKDNKDYHCNWGNSLSYPTISMGYSEGIPSSSVTSASSTHSTNIIWIFVRVFCLRRVYSIKNTRAKIETRTSSVEFILSLRSTPPATPVTDSNNTTRTLKKSTAASSSVISLLKLFIATIWPNTSIPL